MPATYSNHDVTFFYPENWTLSEGASDDSIDVALESPDGAVWSLNIFNDGQSSAHIADQALAALLAEYPELEQTRVEEEVDGVSQTGYDTNFFLLDFVVTCSIRVFQIGTRRFCIIRQAETREYDALAEVHRAVRFSLIKSLEGQSVS